MKLSTKTSLAVYGVLGGFWLGAAFGAQNKDQTLTITPVGTGVLAPSLAFCGFLLGYLQERFCCQSDRLEHAIDNLGDEEDPSEVERKQSFIKYAAAANGLQTSLLITIPITLAFITTGLIQSAGADPTLAAGLGMGVGLTMLLVTNCLVNVASKSCCPSYAQSMDQIRRRELNQVRRLIDGKDENEHQPAAYGATVGSVQSC